MLKQSLLGLTLLLASCTHIPQSTRGAQPPLLPQVAQQGIGETVQRRLTERYNDTRDNCGAATQPAFLCSGVLIRGTMFSHSFHSWDNSLTSHQKGAVSFSYLRKDALSKGIFGANGYIFSPAFSANGKLPPEVLCSFPLDAITTAREGTGCGALPGYPKSGPCQLQGVYTAAQWYAHWLDDPQPFLGSQCGFDVRASLGAGAATAFIATIHAMALIGYTGTNVDELRLAVWPDGQGQNLPLEAFFYVDKQMHGLSGARKDQVDFKNTTGFDVPVIALKLASIIGSDVTFEYRPEDQAIPLP